MRGIRLIRHLVIPDWWVMRPFSKVALADIEQTIERSEASHQGELRFVVEAGLPIDSLWSGYSARDRAVELFSLLKVWDTADNCGVLIYLQLIDRKVEIVADRGIHAIVGQSFWDKVCHDMEDEFRAGSFREGSLTAINAITAELANHFPAKDSDRNELPNAVVVL